LTDDFSYLNARIRIRRSQLLSEGFFKEAIRLSFAELVKVLAESIYGRDLTGEGLGDVDNAVTAHLNRTVTDLPGMVSGNTREAVSLLLLRSDLTNIKTILRGKKAGKSTQEIAGLLGGGTLPRALYSALAEAPDAASLAQILSLPGHPLARALREASSSAREPFEMEIVLDRELFTSMLRRARAIDEPYLARFMTLSIDSMNLTTGFKIHSMGLEDRIERMFLPGGMVVQFPLFERLAKGDAAVLEELGNTVFRRVSEVRDLSTLELKLRCTMLAAAREAARDALGAGLAIDYIQRKEWEAARIRLLARRAFYGLPASSLEHEVFCQ
jgi:V/A-type H+-transporting ATPase subunit C